MDSITEKDNARKRMWLGTVALLAASFIWGTTFVAQSMGTEYIGPFTFNAVRSLVAAAALGLAVLGMTLVRKKRGTYQKPTPKDLRTLWLGGLCCGTVYTLAANLQQAGMAYTTVGKSGFLTALYIIEVPLVGIFLKKRIRPVVWAGVGLALVGMYLLCMDGSFTLGAGDLLVFLCSIAFTGQILAVDHFAGRTDPVQLSCLQFLTAGILSAIPALLFEAPDPALIFAASGAILYAALLSSGIAYTLQIVGQRLVRPTVASLLMSLESVFSLLAGMVVLRQIPSLREGLGALLIFAAIILAQLPKRKGKGEKLPR